MRKKEPNPVAHDVETVKAHARVLIEIVGENLEITRNPNGRLLVIAVVGPTYWARTDIHFKEALLLEVGIGPGRPYHRAKGVNWKQGDNSIGKREKLFQLTENQYLLVAPTLFQIVLELAKKQVEGRISSHRLIRTPQRHFSRKRMFLYEKRILQEMPSGTRFAAHRNDLLLIQDIFFAEWNSQWVQKLIKSRANLIAAALKEAIRRNHSNPSLISGIADLKEVLKEEHSHIRRRIYQKTRELLSLHSQNPLIDEFFEIDPLSFFPEMEMARKAKELGRPEERISLDLIIDSGKKNNERRRQKHQAMAGKRARKIRPQRDHLVFEVLPFVDEIYSNPVWRPSKKQQEEQSCPF